MMNTDSLAKVEFLITHPTLPSLDLGQTVVFYEEQLGFARTRLNEEVAVLKRDGIELHFWKCEDEAIPASSGCRLGVSNVSAFYEHCRSVGIHTGELVGDERYRVFPLNDPDGNLIWCFELHGSPPWER